MAYRLGARRFRWPETAHSPAAERPTWCVPVLEAFFADVTGQPGRPLRFADGSRGYTERMELRSPVASTPAAVSQARKMLARQLQAWELDEVIDDLQIVASELVTNAIRYGTSPVDLCLSLVPGGNLRLEVADSNVTDVPAPRAATDSEPNGRGMPLIDALAADWGVEIRGDRKVVWAELALPA
jgi:anti-sigma regulatory factor (Ser/Thr protein kinase)